MPGTLDGVSVTFAMLAFRAVRKGKTPDRCYRVVWGAALASATINFSYEYGKSGNALAGGYVGLLCLFGMVMFDEFLNQFEDRSDNGAAAEPEVRGAVADLAQQHAAGRDRVAQPSAGRGHAGDGRQRGGQPQPGQGEQT